MKIFTLVIFILTYAGMIALPKKRHFVALGAAVLFLVTGAMPLKFAAGRINWNVLLMLFSTMGTVALFIESRMPDRMADLILKKTPNVMWVAVALSVFSGVVSAFVDNVATVLMIAPVALSIAANLGISPVAMLISIAVSSNLQGAATLVGDTTSIMLGGYADMNFMEFIFMDGRFSIFWAVELGALATVPVIMFLFRKNRQPVTSDKLTEVTDYVPTWLLVLTVVTLIGASFFSLNISLFGVDITNGTICLFYFVIGLIYTLIKKKEGLLKNLFKEDIDYETLL
ncbi:MAG: arsenic transporter, partial [Lachnospiraceae bacterium]|nr:arsenic transporter [Lachnospiraceae bacterium]